jgi:hypothetical protein
MKLGALLKIKGEGGQGSFAVRRFITVMKINIIITHAD